MENKIENKIAKSKYKEFLLKIKKKNVTILFILYCFPFTPSFLLTGAAALTKISTEKFVYIMLPAKLIMMISLALIGQNISSFFENPLKSIFFIIIIILLNILGKFILDKLKINKK